MIGYRIHIATIFALALLPACAQPTPRASGDAICDLSLAARDSLADTLLAHPDSPAVIEGARLIQIIDTACGPASVKQSKEAR